MPRPLLLVLGFIGPLACHCATLSTPDQTAAPGSTVIFSTSFATDSASVSGLQFDLQPAAPFAVRVLPGAQVGRSAKLFFSANLPNNAVRVVIIGMDRAVLADGEVLRLAVTIDQDAAEGASQIQITNALATDPDGNPVPLAASAVNIRVAGAPEVTSFSTGGILNGASFLPGPVSPGEIVTVFGASALSTASDVLFNAAKAPLLYAGSAQVNTIVPFTLDPSTPASLEIQAAGRSLGAIPLTTAAVAPAIFTVSSNGIGPGVIMNEDYAQNSYSTPASAGSIVTIYGTGFGALVPAPNDGESAPGPASTTAPVTATVAGLPADVLYAGAAPGLVAGIVQINVRIPAAVASDPAVPIVLKIGSATTQPGVTLSVN